MKILRRFFIILLAAALGLAQTVSAEAFSDIPFTYQHSQAIHVLNALEIMKGYEDGAFRPEERITRAELIGSIVRMMGISEAEAFRDSGFTDMSGHWAEGYVAVAAAAGIINGYGDGRFAPENNVTYAEIVKILVSLLGYMPAAEIMGGYPNGYITLAARLGLLKRLNLTNFQEETKRAETAALLYNALEIPMAEESYGTDAVKTGEKDDTILKQRLNVSKVHGRVVANPYTGIYGAAKTAAGYLALQNADGIFLYHTDGTEGLDLLGYLVTAYVVEDEHDDKVLYLSKDSDMEELLVLAENILEVSDNRFEYAEGQRNVSVTIEPNATILYNGIYLGTAQSSEITPELLKPSSGNVRVLDSGGEQFWFITSQQSYVVSEVNVDRQKIYLKENIYGMPTIPFDREGKKQRVFLSRNGNSISPEELKENDIITVVAGHKDYEQAEMIRVEAGGEVVTGRVNMLSDDEVQINDRTFARSAECMKTYAVGDEAEFYINLNGELFYLEDKTSRLHLVAYLVGVNVNSGSIAGKVKLKLLCADGTVGVFDCADKISYGGRLVEAAVAGEILSSFSGQLISYHLAENGCVDRVKTAVRDSSADTLDFSGFNTDLFSLDKDAYLTYRRNTPGVLGDNLYLIDDDTLIFDVSGDEEDYAVGTRSFLNDGTAYNMQIYDADEHKMAQFVVNRGTADEEDRIPWNTRIALIEQLSYAVDNEGDIRLKMTGWRSGERVSVFARNNDVGELLNQGESKTPVKLSELSPGTVIQYTVDVRGEMDYIRILHRPGIYSLPEKSWYGAGINSELLTMYGYIYSKTDNSVTVTIDSENYKPFSIQDVNVYVFDAGKNKASSASLDEVMTSYVSASGADRVFCRAFKGNVYDIVIYK